MGGPQEQRLRADELVRRSLPVTGRIHVTGASGWFGRTALDLLARALPGERQRVVAYASNQRTLTLPVGTFGLRPLSELADAVDDGDLLLHFAYRTREQADDDHDAYVRDNVRITASVLDALGSARLGGLFVTSSGAVYRTDGRLATDLDGNPYGTLKHIDELVLRQAARDAGSRTVVCRVFAVGGPFVTKPELFALSDLIRQVAAGDAVTIRARGSVVRAYTAVEDIIAVGIATIRSLDPGDASVFDSGGEEIELGHLVERIAGVLGRAGIPVHRPPLSADENRYVSERHDFDEIARAVGLQPLVLEEQIRRMADDLLGPGTNR